MRILAQYMPMQPLDQDPGSATLPDVPAISESLPSSGTPVEVGGPGGPEPTRYGDWERKGRCIDF
jgi:Protein of unknown function (DUF1674)